MTHINGDSTTSKQLSQASQGSNVQEIEPYEGSETKREAFAVMVDKIWDNAWIYKEWSIWSKCFGKVIVLNGVSSSGKTTLAKHLTRLGYNRISLDDILEEHFISNLALILPRKTSKEWIRILTTDDTIKASCGIMIDKSRYPIEQMAFLNEVVELIQNSSKLVPIPSVLEINGKIYDKAKEFIFSGTNIVVDTVSDNTGLDIMTYCFNHYPISVLLLYSPLKKNLEKCFLRNYQSIENNVCDFRSPESIIKQYLYFYSFRPSETITRCDRAILEKVNKLELSTVLTKVQPHEQLFKAYFRSATQAAQLLEESINTEKELFVTPKINFDVLIFDDYLIEELPLFITRKIESLK